MKFFQQLPSVNKNSEQELNPMLQLLYLLALQTEINNYLMQNMCLNFLIVDLVCKKCIYYFFRDRNIIFLLNSVHQNVCLVINDDQQKLVQNRCLI